MVRRAVTDTRVVVVGAGRADERPDRLATEEPLEIRAGGPGQEPVRVAVTMRTPSNDFELAVGFLFGEGLIGASDIDTVRYCHLGADEEQRYNVVTVGLRRPFSGTTRELTVTSACGVCGSASLDDIADRCQPIATGDLRVDPSLLPTLPDRLRAAQKVFDKTGGLHAAALATADGELDVVREDVGRHNAVDKVVGHALLAGSVPVSDRILVVSGRIAFEIVQKAAAAGIPMIVAVSAPTSLAVDAARRLGVTLVGFARGERCNVYAHPERITLAG